MAETAFALTGVNALERTYEVFADAIQNIVLCDSFNIDEIKTKDLKIAEAFCLLWHDSASGDVFGRKSSEVLLLGAFSACLIDLMVEGKLLIAKHMTNTLDVNNSKEEILLEVVEDSLTATFLDEIVFKMILNQRTTDRSRKPLKYWMSQITEKYCVKLILKSLVDKGIFGEKQAGMFGLFHRYPAIDGAPLEALQKELKDVSLHDKTADSYMTAILTLTRVCDRFFNFQDPILQKHFAKEEYAYAKSNIKKIIRSNELMSKSPMVLKKIENAS